MNYLRTAILLAGLTALFMGVGYLIGGGSGAVIAFLVAAGMNLASYWNADKVVLAMHDAHEVDETTAPDLLHLVQDSPAAPACPCRVSISWTIRSPMRSQPDATPSTRRWR